jgi:glycosyltransferase involved in cell wall biosynthesis
MNILILTQWYPPEPGLLIQELAQTLMAHGHQVTVLTGFPNYPSGQLYPGYRLKLLQRETIAGVPVVRVPLYPEHSRSGIKRALNYLSFAASAATLGWFAVSKPDVMFVYHPPLTIGIPAYVLSRLWRIPFVYQIQDMWPETLRASGMLNNERALKLVGLFADRVYKWSKAICVISPGFRANLISKGVPEEKIHVISNWVDTDTYFPAVPDTETKSKLGLHGKFNVMFAGNIGEGQGLETIVVAAQLLQDCPDVQFVIVGDGIALPRLKEAAEAQNVKNIRFLGRYQAKDMPGLYALADVLLIHLKDDPLFQITIPHKGFAYMASGRPILAAVKGDAANVVMEAHAGISCEPEDPHTLAETVRHFSKMTEGELQEMGKRGLEAVRTKYSREYLVSQIEKVLQAAVNDLPPP